MTNSEKIRAAITAYATQQEQKAEAATEQRRLDAYINEQKPILWEVLKDELNKLCSDSSDAVVLTEESPNSLLVKSTVNEHSSRVDFIDNHCYYVSPFRSAMRGFGVPNDFGDLRCVLDAHGVATLSPYPDIYWTPSRLAFLIVHRIVSGANYVDMKA